jgi:two-component system sensor histidine kinase VicK
MPETEPSFPPVYPFLQGGGEMGELIRAFDWSSHLLGTPDQWPAALKIAVAMVLGSPFPMHITWGEQFIQLYNDGYRPVLGKLKHPKALGNPIYASFPEIWETVGPMFHGVMEGKAVRFPDFKLYLERNGFSEECYFDFAYSPIRDENGVIRGVLTNEIETTEKVISHRQLELRANELQESEERFRTMAEDSDILIAVGDESSNAIYFSKAWVELTGRPMNELLEFGWVDLVHPEDKERYVNIYLSAFKERIPFQGEFRILSQAGEYRWLLAKGPPRFRPDGSFAGYISTCVDISARKKWEITIAQSSEELQAINEEMVSSNEELASTNEELTSTNEELIEIQRRLETETFEKQKAFDNIKANEENIRNMVLQSPVGMCIIEGEPLFVREINDSFLAILGKSREALKTRPYWEVNSEVADLYKPITDHVMATGTTYHANEHAIPMIRNGVEELVHVDFVYEPMKDGEGKTYAIMIVAIDVSDKVLARKKVERAEESLRMAIDAAGLGSYHINVIDRIFYPSPKLKEFFGFGPDEEVPYEAAINQIHEDYRQQVADQVEAAIIKGLRFDTEYPIVGHNDGKIRWVRGIGTVQQDDEGVNRYFTGVLHEITEQKKDELRKNDFIGMVSHELKTPLTSLTALIQVANSKLKESEDAFLSGAMDKANTQVKRMTRMINGFLNISRLEAGKILIDKHHFDLEQLIEEMIRETRMTVTSHEIRFEPCQPVVVSADMDKIGSVITNLISNAVKYSPKGKLIDIKCELTDGFARVSVHDEGMGIKPADLENLFERYYRVESKHTQHISGFGIGLYLSAEIIQRHDGRIWAESKSGVGSTFYFSLPLIKTKSDEEKE